MTLPQTQGCDGRLKGRVHRSLPSCGRLGRTPAAKIPNARSDGEKKRKCLTSDATSQPIIAMPYATVT
jgi:hypothetical protein